MQDDDIEEVIADPSLPASTRVQDHRCAAGEHCGMKTTPLAPDGGYVCMNCDKKLHGSLCGTLWDERGDDCRVGVEDLSAHGRNKTTVVGALICLGCTGV